MSRAVQIGFGKVDITPELEQHEVYGLGYWSNRRMLFTGVRDRLHVRAAAVGEGSDLCFIISVDAIYDSFDFGKRACQQIAIEHNVSADRVFITCTHSHSTPMTGLNNHDPQGDDAYGLFVSGRIVESARVAAASREEGELVRMSAAVEDVICNRRRVLKSGNVAEMFDDIDMADVMDPGPVNRTMTLLKAYASDGRFLGAFCHFGIHLVCVQATELISSDCMGRAIQRIEQEDKGGVVLHLNGACGDINPVAIGGEDDLESIARRLYKALGELMGAKGQPLEPGRVQTWREDVSVARRDTRSVGTLSEIQNRLQKEVASYSGRDPHLGPGFELLETSEERHVAEMPEQFDISCHAIRFGGLLLVGIGGEIFTVFGNRLIDSWRAMTVLPVGITHGWAGYLPPSEAFEQGGYEVCTARWCPIRPGESERLFLLVEARVRAIIGD